LRQDNADLRLSPLGYELGLLPERNHQSFQRKQKAIVEEMLRIENTRVGGISLLQMLRRPELTYDALPGAKAELGLEITQQVEIAVKYAGYIDRQEIDVARHKSLEDKQIPSSFDYTIVPSLRTEARQKLIKIRPGTLGQASRISGVSPADIGILMVWLKRGCPAPETAIAKASESDELD
jgi:tRNA uridine 5-carboxymethylaminomethyl modification enzyme